MKKRYLLFIIAIASLMFDCATQKYECEGIHDNNMVSATTKNNVENEKIENEWLSKSDVISEKIIFIEDKCDEWTNTLKEKGKLIADFNQDMMEDGIQIIYEEKEGSQYINQFTLLLARSKGSFVISDYDASFQKIEMIDIDKDNINELIILFDTHGGGGEGTHDLYIIWFNTDEIIAKKMNTVDMSFLNMEASWSIDDIYDIDKIEFGGEENLLVHQYVWGENGHSDAIGNLVSIVSLNKELNKFEIEKCWLERRDTY